MRFEYDSSSVRNTVIAAAIIAVVSLFLPTILLKLIGLSVAAGPALWALVQWRRHGRGICLEENHVVFESALIGRSKRIPYVDIFGCASTTDQGLIVAYVRRTQQQSTTGDYPALSRTTLAQARPPAGIRRAVISSSSLKDIQGCLAALSEHLIQNPPGLADQFSVSVLRSMAVRKNRRNTVLFVLAVLATPIYVIIITRLVDMFH